MNAINTGRGALMAFALVMAAGTCATEVGDPAPSDPLVEPEPTATAVDILVEVLRPDGRGVIGADVAMALTDGTFQYGTTDGGGRVWMAATPDRVKSIVASKAQSTFEALHGSFVLDKIVHAEPVTLVVTPHDPPIETVRVRGELENVVDVSNQLKITATVPHADFFVPFGTGTFWGQVPTQPFTLLGLEWRRLPAASTRSVLREMVAWAHADAPGPFVNGMKMTLDFAPPPAIPWAKGDPFPWTRRHVTGTLLAPRDERLRDEGRADLSIHFLGTDGNGSLGGATATTPTAAGFDYAVSYEAPIPGAVETHVTVTAGGEVSGAWLIGPPPAGELAVDLLSPPTVVLDTPNLHDAIQWALSPEEDHDVTVVYLRRDGVDLGRMILPPYLRTTSVPVMPTFDAEKELMAGPMDVVVEICATDPLRDRCERYARSAAAEVTLCTTPTCGEP